jgi:hypothetical protein
MQDIPNKTDYVDTLPASQFNQITNELENIITSSGQTLSGADLQQIAKSIASYAGCGDFYTDSGAADAYVLSAVGSKLTPPAYVDGMRFRFIPANTNTTASTANPAGLGARAIKKLNGTADVEAGDIQDGQITELVYNSALNVLTLNTSVGITDFIASGNGYIQFSNGIIIQWLTITGTTTSVSGPVFGVTVVANWPLAWPNGTGPFAMGYMMDNATAQLENTIFDSSTATQITVALECNGNGVSLTSKVIAIVN